MNEYAKRTCSNCGLKLPQPQMNQRVVSLQVARGKRGLSKRELVGTLVGSKKAKNSLLNWLFAPNVRNYERKQKIWLCDECAGNAPRSAIEQDVDDRRQSNGLFVSLSKFWIWMLILPSLVLPIAILNAGDAVSASELTDATRPIFGAVVLTQLYYLLAIMIRPQKRKTFTSFAFQYCSAIAILFWCLAQSSFADIWIVSFNVINLFLLHRLSRSASEEEV